VPLIIQFAPCPFRKRTPLSPAYNAKVHQQLPWHPFGFKSTDNKQPSLQISQGQCQLRSPRCIYIIIRLITDRYGEINIRITFQKPEQAGLYVHVHED
jgi:hypothetical protein